MSAFLDGLKDELETMEQQIQALSGHIDSVVTHLEWSKLRSLFLRLNQDYSKLLQDEQAWHQACTGIVIITTDRAMAEEISRLKNASTPNVRVVSGKGQVKAMAISNLARENKMTAPEIILNLREQGYLVFGWNQYQKLLDEIGNLISGHEEQGKLTELPEPPVLRLPLPF